MADAAKTILAGKGPVAGETSPGYLIYGEECIGTGRSSMPYRQRSAEKRRPHRVTRPTGRPYASS